MLCAGIFTFSLGIKLVGACALCMVYYIVTVCDTNGFPCFVHGCFRCHCCDTSEFLCLMHG